MDRTEATCNGNLKNETTYFILYKMTLLSLPPLSTSWSWNGLNLADQTQWEWSSTSTWTGSSKFLHRNATSHIMKIIRCSGAGLGKVTWSNRFINSSFSFDIALDIKYSFNRELIINLLVAYLWIIYTILSSWTIHLQNKYFHQRRHRLRLSDIYNPQFLWLFEYLNCQSE